MKYIETRFFFVVSLAVSIYCHSSVFGMGGRPVKENKLALADLTTDQVHEKIIPAEGDIIGNSIGILINNYRLDGQEKHKVRVSFISDSHSLHEYIYLHHKDNDKVYSNDPSYEYALEETLRKFPKSDVYVFAGDVTSTGTLEQFQHLSLFLNKLIESDITKYVVLISGNHDIGLDITYPAKKNKNINYTLEEIQSIREGFFNSLHKNVIYLQDSSIELFGLKFYGTPWVHEDSYWGFSEGNLKNILNYWREIPNDTDVLITHSPPYLYGDRQLDPMDSNIFKHVGSKELLKIVKKIKPKIHVFGHIHEGNSVTWDNKKRTIFINAAMCTEFYKPVNMIYTIDLDSK